MAISVKEIAWAAGIYEGEGSCGTQRYSKKLKKTGLEKVYTLLQATVSQKDPWILFELQRLFGGRINTYPNSGCSKAWISRWRVCGAKARGFLQTVYVLLSPRRREQVSFALKNSL